MSIPLVEHDKVDLSILQLTGELDQMLKRAAKPIKLRHHELIARAVGGQQRLLQLRATRKLSGRRLDEDLLAPGGSERVVLRFWVLIARRHPTVAEQHQISVRQRPMA